MRVDAASGEDHRNGKPSRTLMFVCQHDTASPVLHRRMRFSADAVQRFLQRFSVVLDARNRIGAVDLDDLGVEIIPEPGEHAIGQDRAFQHEHIRLGFIGDENVAEIFEPRFQAHHAIFTQRIDRRIGHLTEILAEEMRQRPIAFGQYRNRRVIAHRANRFLAVLDHRPQDQIQRLKVVSGRALSAQQFFALVQPLFRTRTDLRFQLDDVSEPFRIGMLICEQVENFI